MNSRLIWVAIWMLLSVRVLGAPGTVLTLVDSTLYSDAAVSNKLAEWKAQVEREGWYRIDLRTRTRVKTRFDTNRLAEITAIRSLIAASNYVGVQCWGAIAMGVAGWINPDGHAARPFDTDLPFLTATNYAFTDSVNNGSNSYGTNAIGDGYWDDNAAPFVRPVARVSFHDLVLTDSGTTWPSPCFTGQPVAPAVDETNATIAYLQRDLDYRRGIWRPARTGYIVGSLWSTVSGSVNYLTSNTPQVTWTINTAMPGGAQGGRPLFLWENAAISEINLFFDSNCAWPTPVWLNTYRSFMMEGIMNWSDCYIRRWLQYALVSTWGPNWWVCPSTSNTVFDGIRGTSTVQSDYWIVWAVCWGDGTLPVIRVPPHASATTARVGGIRRQ